MCLQWPKICAANTLTVNLLYTLITIIPCYNKQKIDQQWRTTLSGICKQIPHNTWCQAAITFKSMYQMRSTIQVSALSPCMKTAFSIHQHNSHLFVFLGQLSERLKSYGNVWDLGCLCTTHCVKHQSYPTLTLNSWLHINSLLQSSPAAHVDSNISHKQPLASNYGYFCWDGNERNTSQLPKWFTLSWLSGAG